MKAAFERILRANLKNRHFARNLALSRTPESRQNPGKCLLDKNPYMYDIYPTEEKRRFLTVFQLYDGIGEWYDLSILPAKSGTFKVGCN